MRLKLITLLSLVFLVSCADTLPQLRSEKEAAARGKRKANELTTTDTTTGIEKDKDGKVKQAGGAKSFEESLLKRFPQLAEMNVAELQLALRQRRRENDNREAEIRRVVAQNKLMCKRVNQIRKTCVISANIIPTGENKYLDCEIDLKKAKQQRQARKGATFKVVPTNPAAVEDFLTSKGDQAAQSYELVINEIYRSSAFGPSGGTVTFSEIAHNSKFAPELREAYDIRLQPAGATGSPTSWLMVPPMNIEFQVDDKRAFSSTARLGSDDYKHKQYSYDLVEIRLMAETKLCSEHEAFIKKLKDDIGSAAADLEADAVKAEFSDADIVKILRNPSATKAQSTREGVIKLIQDEEFRRLEADPIFSFESERARQLEHMLVPPGSVGCRLNTPIQAIQVVLSGEHNYMSLVTRKIQEYRWIPESRKARSQPPQPGDPPPAPQSGNTTGGPADQTNSLRNQDTTNSGDNADLTDAEVFAGRVECNPECADNPPPPTTGQPTTGGALLAEPHEALSVEFSPVLKIKADAWGGTVGQGRWIISAFWKNRSGSSET